MKFELKLTRFVFATTQGEVIVDYGDLEPEERQDNYRYRVTVHLQGSYIGGFATGAHPNKTQAKRLAERALNDFAASKKFRESVNQAT